jgi:hypothetical protein
LLASSLLNSSSRKVLSSKYHDPPVNGEADSLPIRADNPPRGAESGTSPWAIMAAVAGAALIVVGALVLLRIFVGENIPDLTDETLAAARARWEQNGPASYDLDIQIEGRQPGLVHVEVRNGEVTLANRDGRATPERTWDEWSVPGQFDTLERELEMAADPQGEMGAPRGARLWLRCEFDPKIGYPQKYHRYATGGAIETAWETTAFEPK